MNGLIVDCFAGGGGASTGLEWAYGRSPDIAINHDAEALAMHRSNHPATEHLINDIHRVDPVAATRGQRVAVAWFSPDCTHHSKAKGSKPRRDGKGSRDMGWVVVHWAKRVRPSVIMLENVEEWQEWGPLDIHEKPCPHRKGQEFKRWVNALRRLGYKVEWRELRACDFGAPTIRKRLIVVARCDGLPIRWPEPTHAPATDPRVLAGELQPYRTAAEIIDWTVPCPSIFLTREEARELRRTHGIICQRPLKPNTMRRIAQGVVRYVLDDPAPFIVSVAHGDSGGRRAYPGGDPLGTVTMAPQHAVVAPVFTYAQHGGRSRSPGDPLHTITASNKDQNGIIMPTFAPAIMTNTTGHAGAPVGAPVATVTTGSHHALVAAFLAQHNTGMVGHRADKPVSTIVNQASTQALVGVHMLNLKGSDRRARHADAPLATITAEGGHAAAVSAFLVKYYGTAIGQRLGDPAHTVTSKDRFGLVTVQIGGEPWVLTDIGMRMLTARELYRAQGFPDDYEIEQGPDGERFTVTAQRRMCGNSVSPHVAAAVARANMPGDAPAARVVHDQLELVA